MNIPTLEIDLKDAKMVGVLLEFYERYPLKIEIRIESHDCIDNKFYKIVDTYDLFKYVDGENSHLCIKLDATGSMDVIDKFCLEADVDKDYFLSDLYSSFINNFTEFFIMESHIYSECSKANFSIYKNLNSTYDKQESITKNIVDLLHQLELLVHDTYFKEFKDLVEALYEWMVFDYCAYMYDLKVDSPNKTFISEDGSEVKFYKSEYGFMYYFDKGIKINKKEG